MNRLALAALRDTAQAGRDSATHVLVGLSRARRAVVCAGLFVVGSDRCMRRFVAYSLETGELRRGVL